MAPVLTFVVFAEVLRRLGFQVQACHMDCVGTQRWLFVVAQHVGGVVGQLVADSAPQPPLGIVQRVEVKVVGVFWNRGDAVSESIWPLG